jgi:hypothetical protein
VKAVTVLVCGLAAAWYGFVLYKTWPVGLLYWPLWVLAGVIAWAAYNRVCDWLEARELRRRYDALDTSSRPT